MALHVRSDRFEARATSTSTVGGVPKTGPRTERALVAVPPLVGSSFFAPTLLGLAVGSAFLTGVVTGFAMPVKKENRTRTMVLGGVATLTGILSLFARNRLFVRLVGATLLLGGAFFSGQFLGGLISRLVRGRRTTGSEASKSTAPLARSTPRQPGRSIRMPPMNGPFGVLIAGLPESQGSPGLSPSKMDRFEFEKYLEEHGIPHFTDSTVGDCEIDYDILTVICHENIEFWVGSDEDISVNIGPQVWGDLPLPVTWAVFLFDHDGGFKHLSVMMEQGNYLPSFSLFCDRDGNCESHLWGETHNPSPQDQRALEEVARRVLDLEAVVVSDTQ